MNDSHTSVTKSQLPGVWNAGRDCPELISIHFKGQEFLIRSRERRGGSRGGGEEALWGCHPQSQEQADGLQRERPPGCPCSVKVPLPLPMDVTFPRYHRSTTKLTIIYLLNPKRPHIARTAIRKMCKNKTPTRILLILPTFSLRQFT